MADGTSSLPVVSVRRDYLAAGKRLGLCEADTIATWWLVMRCPDYYRGDAGPKAFDLPLSALMKHAEIECGGVGTCASVLDDGGDDSACHGQDGSTFLYEQAAEILHDVIARTPRRQKGTRPRWERRAEEDRRKAREAHQLWFCGADWRMDAANDDDDDEDNDGETE